MSYSQIDLEYEENLPGGDVFPGQTFRIVARSPMRAGDTVQISHLCLDAAEIDGEVRRIINALSKVTQKAKRRDREHRRKVQATAIKKS